MIDNTKYGFHAAYKTEKKLLRQAGAVLALLAHKADGDGPLDGNEGPWIDLANNVGLNLFDIQDAEIGKTILWDGDTSPLAGSNVSGFIRITPNKNYFIGSRGSSVGKLFDSNKEPFTTDSFDVNTNGGIFNTDNLEAAYIRLKITDSELATFMFNEGDTPLPYEAYTKNNAKLFNFAGNEDSGWNKDGLVEANVVKNAYYEEGVDYWLGIDNVVDQIAEKLPTGQYSGVTQVTTSGYTNSHKYFVSARIKAFKNTVSFALQTDAPGWFGLYHSGNGKYEDIYYSCTLTGASEARVRVRDDGTDNFQMIYLEGKQSRGGGVFMFDLTEIGEYFPELDLLNKDDEWLFENRYMLADLQKYAEVIRFEGTDDYCSLANNPALDIIEAPLAIGMTFKKQNSSTQFLSARNYDTADDVQYGILAREGYNISFYSGGDEAMFNHPIDEWVNVVFYYDGTTVKGYKNGILQNETSLPSLALTSELSALSLGMRTQTGIPVLLFEGNLATCTIYTGDDINKILKAEKKISQRYLYMNP